MKRILVIGGPGSGKSTLARRLHAITGAAAVPPGQALLAAGLAKDAKRQMGSGLWRSLPGRDAWIMDGGYNSSFHIRMPRADTVLWPDLPGRVAFPRVVKRWRWVWDV